MRRIALPLLLTLLFLGLAGTSAWADILFFTGGPQTPSPVGFGPLGPAMPSNPIPSVSWNCAFVGGCDVTDIHYSEFTNDGSTPTPDLLDIVNFGKTPFAFTGDINNIAGFSSPVVPGSAGLGCFTITGVTWCNESLTFAAVHVPEGKSYINLYGEHLSGAQVDTFWSNSGSTSIISNTLSQDPMTGVITQFPSQLSFTVTGTGVGAEIPEPSSMMLIGSGLLGLAGVLRRKLMR